MTRLAMIATAAFGLGLAGCAADGGLMPTGSIDSAAKTQKVAAVDPACVALTNQIDTIKKEGAIEGLEKAATGKGASVKVKRDALSKQTELNRLNADFQAKCGPKIPAGQQAAAVQVPAVTPIAAAPAAAAAAPAKKQ